MERNLSKNAEQLFEQAIELHQQGKFAQAKMQYQSLLSESPDNILGLHFFGLFLAQNGKYAEALPHLKKSIRIEPDNPACLNTLASVYSALDKYNLAIKTYRQILDLEPDNLIAQDNIQQLYYQQKSTKNGFFYVLDIGGSGLKYAISFDNQISPIFKISARKKAQKQYLLKKYGRECMQKFREEIWDHAPAPVIVSTAGHFDQEFIHDNFPEQTKVYRFSDTMSHIIGTIRNLKSGKIKQKFKNKLPAMCIVLGSGLGFGFITKHGEIYLHDLVNIDSTRCAKKLRSIQGKYSCNLAAATFLPMLLNTNHQTMPTIATSPFGKARRYTGKKIAVVRRIYKQQFYAFSRTSRIASTRFIYLITFKILIFCYF